jgi:delta24-sterol reductase
LPRSASDLLTTLLCFMCRYSLVNCSATENTDLYYSVPWSHGTLGFVVSVELQMVRAKPYVELAYLPYHTKSEAVREFARHSREAKYDFVECLAYSKDKYVVMVGTLVETKNIPGTVYNPIGRWYKEWFYKHVEHCLERNYGVARSKKDDRSSTEDTALLGVHHREVIPLRHYYHRHTRGLFWEMSDIVPFGNNVVFRYLLGWMMPPRPSLLKRTQTEALRKLYEQHHMVQDMLVPMGRLEECLGVFEAEAGIYPLWLCPFKIPSNASSTQGSKGGKGGASGPKERGFIHPCDGGKGEDLFVDVGAYGNPSVSNYEAKANHRRIEEYVRSVQGYQMMYADSYMSRYGNVVV